jgi:hypothetical protein
LLPEEKMRPLVHTAVIASMLLAPPALAQLPTLAREGAAAGQIHRLTPPLECHSCPRSATNDLGTRRVPDDQTPAQQPLACAMREMPLGPSLPGCTPPPLEPNVLPPM